MTTLFWLCVILILYVYAGYPALLWLIRRVYHRPVQKDDITPFVTLGIAAHNEAEHIRARLENCLALDYPRERLEIVVVSDGSTDGTQEIVRAFASRGVRLVDLPRVGKAEADNAIVNAARGEIVVTTSATGWFPPDFLGKIVRSFADPDVGAVTGLFRPYNGDETPTAATEGFYYRYEMFIRRLESDLGILVTSGGVALAFRRDLFARLAPDSDADNMVPLLVATARKRVVFEPEAIATDDASRTPEEQFAHRVRSVTRSLRDRLRMRHLLSPLCYPGPAFSLWSHKLLRWAVPIFALGAFFSNLFLLDIPFYRLVFLGQIAFYILAWLGFVWRHLKGHVPRALALPMHLIVIHAAFLVGILNVLRGRRVTMWTRGERPTVHT